MGEQTQISSTIEELQNVITHLPKTKQKQYADALTAISNRLHSVELKLAVIGNFSCGKSTFLNALLGRELLSVSNLPTTAIPTYIRWNKSVAMKKYGAKNVFDSIWRFFCRLCSGRKRLAAQDPIVVITDTDGKVFPLLDGTIAKCEKALEIRIPQSINQMIDYLTTTNALIDKIARIELHFPERDGFHEFCLIDTPGINPGDEAAKKHILQTQSLLQAEADAAIVLYPSFNTMTKNVENFMVEYAANLMDRAIVLLTKMDIVESQKEREKVIKYTQREVQRRFGQTEPAVYGISAGKCLAWDRRNTSDDNYVWYQNFHSTMRKILASLDESRELLVRNKLSAMVDSITYQLTVAVEASIQDMVSQKAIMQSHSKEYLEQDFKRLFQNYCTEIQSYAQDAEKISKECVIARKSSIIRAMQEMNSMGDIRRMANRGFQAHMRGIDQEIAAKLRDSVFAPLEKHSQELKDKTEICLREYQRHVGGVLQSGATSSLNPQDVAVCIKKGVSDSAAVPIAGGILASLGVLLVCPPLAALGFLVAPLLDRINFEERKQRTIEEMENHLSDYADDLSKAYRQKVSDLLDQNRAWGSGLLSNYQKQYQTFYEKAEQKYQTKVKKLEAGIAEKKNDIEVLSRIHLNVCL